MRANWRAALFFAGLTLCVLGPSPVLAQDNPQYAEKKAAATEAYQAGRFEEAAILFKEAFEIESRGNLLYNVAICYDKAGNTAEAVTWYQRFVDAVPDAKRGPQVQQRIDELRRTLAGRYEEVAVSTAPPGAVIFVDDKAKGAMGTAPVSFKLLPGTYTIIAELDGHEPTRKKITLSEGRPAAVDLRLTPSGSVGELSILVSEPGARISVDGKDVGRSPLDAPLRLRRGPHEVRVEKPGYAATTRQVEVKARDKQRISISLGEEGTSDLAGGSPGGGGGAGFWPYVAMGVGVGLVGGAVFTGLQAQGLHDQLDEKRSSGELIASQDVDTGNNLVLITNLLYGLGGLAIAGGATWWVMDSGMLSTSGGGEIQAGLVPTPEGGTVQILGRF